jgi:hypothetical protein
MVWFGESTGVDLRYDVKLQNAWIEIIRREGVRSVAMMEEINGCPHEEGVDYPLGEVCPACPFWAHRRRPLEPPATVLTAIATYRQDQWETLLAAAADRDTMDETLEKWNAGIEKLIAGLEARSIPYVRVLLDVEEIEQFCEEQGIPNDAKARSNLAIRKAEQSSLLAFPLERRSSAGANNQGTSKEDRLVSSLFAICRYKIVNGCFSNPLIILS